MLALSVCKLVVCRAAKVALLQVGMPYWASDWWDGYYWDYNTWRWEWGGGQPNHVPVSQPSQGSQPGVVPPNDANGAANVQPQNDNDEWAMPSVLEEADATYRIRTLKATPMEYDAIVEAFKDNEGANRYLTRIMRHWGKHEVYNDCKALLSMLQTAKPSEVGEAVAPGSAEFAIAKCMLAGHRAAHGDRDGACHCLPMMYVAGCRHNKPPLIAPRKGLQDSMCHHCSKCIRCSGLPSCTTTKSTCHSPQFIIPKCLGIQGCARKSRRTCF